MGVEVAKYFSEWGNAAFIIGVVFSSSLADYAMIGSLMDFLRNVRHEKLPYAAATLNVQAGLGSLMAVAGAFLTDAYLGHYRMLLFSTVIYIAGLSLFTLAASPVSKIGAEEGFIFYMALILISMGQGGHDPSLKSLGSHQIGDHGHLKKEEKEARTKAWWYTGKFMGMGVGLIVASFVGDEPDWMTAGAVSAVVMLVALVVFLGGTLFCYVYVQPCGSLLTRVARVVVAAGRNRNADAGQLYEKSKPLDGEQLLPHTDGLRYLDKAAIKAPNAGEENKWRLCTVTQVEETKLLLGMFPIWTTFLMYGLIRAMGSTFFIEQAIKMDRKMGQKITVPLTSLLAFASTSKLVVTQLCVPLIEKSTKLEHGIPPMIKIGIGMFFSILCCGCASTVENKRLDVVKQLGPSKTVPTSVFWLLPQFFLLGSMDGLVSDGLKEFFDCNESIPNSMKSFGPSFSQSVIGMGSLLSAILIIISTKVSKQGGSRWIADTVNQSHLDYFYRTFSVLSYINLCAYMCISSMYCMKKVKVEEEDLEFVKIENQ